jgi:hypothetical protein
MFYDSEKGCSKLEHQAVFLDSFGFSTSMSEGKWKLPNFLVKVSNVLTPVLSKTKEAMYV